RVEHDAEIGPATDLVDVIDRLVGSLFKVGGGRADEVAARREAHHADLLRIDAPVPGLAAHQADGALRVLDRAQRRLALDVARPPRAAVPEGDGGDAERVQPGGYFLAFHVPAQVVVAAAGADQHGDARVLLRRPIDRDARLADVREPPGRLAADLMGLAVAGLQLEEFFLAADAGI